MLRTILAIAALSITGCAIPQQSTPDAADAQSRFGADVLSRYEVPVTGRDWNCKGCYK